MEKVIFGKQLNGFGVGEKMEFAKKLQIPFLPICYCSEPYGYGMGKLVVITCHIWQDMDINLEKSPMGSRG